MKGNRKTEISDNSITDPNKEYKIGKNHIDNRYNKVIDEKRVRLEEPV